ncbi:aldehyde dehydrogenase [Coprinopsis cinerea AmutBmut pab1-1]|nr:aldehyde dehydrogenase [Coprinopsis cinerea AmutBmut pab1-1]
MRFPTHTTTFRFSALLSTTTSPTRCSSRLLFLKLSPATQPRRRMASSQAAVFGLNDPSLIKFQGLIDGKWLDAKSGEIILVTNPATNEELGTVPEMGLEETKEAIEAAAKAFTTWGRTTAKYRHDLLIKFFQLMQQHQDDLARLITLENGKTLTEAKGETAYSASFIEWFGEDTSFTRNGTKN